MDVSFFLFLKIIIIIIVIVTVVGGAGLPASLSDNLKYRTPSFELEPLNEVTLNYGAIFRPFGVIILKHPPTQPNTTSSNHRDFNSMRMSYSSNQQRLN